MSEQKLQSDETELLYVELEGSFSTHGFEGGEIFLSKDERLRLLDFATWKKEPPFPEEGNAARVESLHPTNPIGTYELRGVGSRFGKMIIFPSSFENPTPPVVGEFLRYEGIDFQINGAGNFLPTSPKAPLYGDQMDPKKAQHLFNTLSRLQKSGVPAPIPVRYGEMQKKQGHDKAAREPCGILLTGYPYRNVSSSVNLFTAEKAAANPATLTCAEFARGLSLRKCHDQAGLTNIHTNHRDYIYHEESGTGILRGFDEAIGLENLTHMAKGMYVLMDISKAVLNLFDIIINAEAAEKILVSNPFEALLKGYFQFPAGMMDGAIEVLAEKYNAKIQAQRADYKNDSSHFMATLLTEIMGDLLPLYQRTSTHQKYPVCKSPQAFQADLDNGLAQYKAETSASFFTQMKQSDQAATYKDGVKERAKIERALASADDSITYLEQHNSITMFFIEKLWAEVVKTRGQFKPEIVRPGRAPSIQLAEQAGEFLFACVDKVAHEVRKDPAMRDMVELYDIYAIELKRRSSQTHDRFESHIKSLLLEGLTVPLALIDHLFEIYCQDPTVTIEEVSSFLLSEECLNILAFFGFKNGHLESGFLESVCPPTETDSEIHVRDKQNKIIPIYRETLQRIVRDGMPIIRCREAVRVSTVSIFKILQKESGQTKFSRCPAAEVFTKDLGLPPELMTKDATVIKDFARWIAQLFIENCIPTPSSS